MTNAEKVMLGLGVGTGITGAISSSKQNKANQKDQAASQLDQTVQRMMAALQNAQQTGQNLQTNRQQMPQTQAELSPLGQEQSFLQKQRMLQTLLPMAANFSVGGPTDPGVAGSFRAPTNMLAGLNSPGLMQSVGDQATAQSLADRRKLMAQINPDYEFSSLEGFGLDKQFDAGVNRASEAAGSRLKSYEDAQSNLASQQIGLANQQLTNAQTAAQQPEEKKGGGFLGGLGKVLKVAAPIAAMAIPGVGPIAAAAIAGGGTALGSKMAGEGWGAALGQGALSGVGSGVGKSLAQGKGFNPFNDGHVLNNGMTAASLPVGMMGGGPNGLQAPVPTIPRALGLNEPGFLQSAVKQNAPDMARVIGGGSRPPTAQPQPKMPQPPMPFASSHTAAPPAGRIPLPGRQQGDAGYTDAQHPDPKINAMINEFMNSGLGRGFSEGGLGMGAGNLIGVTRVLPSLAGGSSAGQLGPGQSLPQLGAGQTLKMIGSGSIAPKQLGPGQYNAGPMGSSSMSRGSTFNLPAQSGSTIQNQQNAQSIMQTLGANNGMSTGAKAAMNADPATQAIYQQLATALKNGIPAGMSPQQFMQMVIRGGG